MKLHHICTLNPLRTANFVQTLLIIEAPVSQGDKLGNHETAPDNTAVESQSVGPPFFVWKRPLSTAVRCLLNSVYCQKISRVLVYFDVLWWKLIKIQANRVQVLAEEVEFWRRKS